MPGSGSRIVRTVDLYINLLTLCQNSPSPDCFLFEGSATSEAMTATGTTSEVRRQAQARQFASDSASCIVARLVCQAHRPGCSVDLQAVSCSLSCLIIGLPCLSLQTHLIYNGDHASFHKPSGCTITAEAGRGEGDHRHHSAQRQSDKRCCIITSDIISNSTRTHKVACLPVSGNKRLHPPPPHDNLPSVTLT